jgi:hypothetical protein
MMNLAPGSLDAETLVKHWAAITPRVVSYGFGLGYGTLERPRPGIFDGMNLTTDPAVGLEMHCFLSLHLSGPRRGGQPPPIDHRSSGYGKMTWGLSRRH